MHLLATSRLWCRNQNTEDLTMDTVWLDLPGGLRSAIDAEDFERICSCFSYEGRRFEAKPCDYSWQVVWGTHCPYVVAKVGGFECRLHRLVSSAPAGLHADHKDFDTFNNRKINLRICTVAQNLHARRYKPGGSGYRGVQPTASGKFMARIYVGNRDVSLGTYLTAEEAARVRDAKALELFGEFAALNFPIDQVA